jgi:hypothetical protein
VESLAWFVELRLIAVLRRVLQFSNNQADPFLTDCDTRRKVKENKQRAQNPNQTQPHSSTLKVNV